MKAPKYEDIDKSLYLLFTEQRERGVPISSPILQQKAKSITENLPLSKYPVEFTASVKWMNRWKKRHGIRPVKICGEKLSANPARVADFKDKLKIM